MPPILAVPDRRETSHQGKSSAPSSERPQDDDLRSPPEGVKKGRVGPSHSCELSPQIANLIRQHQERPGGLLPLLHEVQDLLGYVPPVAVPAIASALNLSRAEVHGVLSYYHFFREEQPGHQVIQLCRAEACQACGAEDLLVHAERTLNCKLGHTRGDGAVTLEAVYCLGLCASSPALQINGQVHARVTTQRLDQLLQAHWQAPHTADVEATR